MQFVINGFTQAAAAVVLASLFYLGHVVIARFRGKERQAWNRWLGLYKPPRAGEALLYLVACLGIGGGFALMTRFLVPDYLEMAQQTPQHQIAALPFGVMLLAAPTYAFVTTGFSEELIFRGVLAKRLIAWFGYGVGNAAQALVFGLLHVGLVRLGAPGSSLVTYALLGGFVTAMAWVTGWAMERRGEGSIVFPWMMHAGANLATTAVYVIAPVG